MHFGEHVIVHPGCSIVAEGGDIYIGDYVIIEEKVRILNRLKKDEQGKPIKRDMTIGNYNVFEVYAYIENTNIGNLNEFQHRSVVQDSTIGDCCQINPCVSVPRGSLLDSCTVVYDEGKLRKNMEPNEEAKKTSIKELCLFLLE